MTQPAFPPLLCGHAVDENDDPFVAACALAAQGCDGGLVVYNLGASTLSAAIVFAPEVPLADAMAMLPLCAVAFQNALGALAPPEIAVYLNWDGGIRVNGASCGGLTAAASITDPAGQPDWLVVSLKVPLWPQSDNPGDTPDKTALYAEGCADVDAVALLESWARHMLVGLNRWLETGAGPLHQEWCGLAHGMGEPAQIGGAKGTYLGIDERFGMLLKDETKTHLIPLTTLLEHQT